MPTRAIRAGLSAALTLCCLLGAQQAQAQKYRLADLGPGIATGIADDGTVSGYTVSAWGWPQYHAAVWAPGATQPTLIGEFAGDIYSMGTAISGTGTVAGFSYHIGGTPRYQTLIGTYFTWNASTGLQPVPWAQQYPGSAPTAINRLGHLGSQNAIDPAQPDRTKPFLWRAETGITFINGTASLAPHGIESLNDQDQLVGTASSTADVNASVGYFWSPATGIKPITSPSKTYSDVFPTLINAQGQVAGYLKDPKTGRTRLFTWSARYGTTDLMLLNSYAEDLVPLSIDKNYRVVGKRVHVYGPNDGSSAPPVGFVWTLLTGVKDIHGFIIDNGPASAPIVTLSQMTAVNESGQIVAMARINDEPHIVRLDVVR